MDHPAVRYHGSGVSTWDLSTFIARISDRAEERVVGIGHEQYGHLVGPQKFETYTPEEEYEELLDEIADAVAYLAFVAIKAGHVTRRTVAKQEANRG